MFGLFGRKRVAEDAGDAPLRGRDGHVGGIESIVVDGTTLYFGFDFGADLVLSPLIADRARMMAFATRHMRQRDGVHDAAYWSALMDDCEGHSDLCSDEAGRTFDTAELAAIAARLRDAAATDAPQPGFALPYHLRYLLAAAAGWPEGFDFEAGEELAACIAGDDAPDSHRIADCAVMLQAHLASLVDDAPGNWSRTFAAIRE